jgi:Leu/Phe-tRNA-protein transferase
VLSRGVLRAFSDNNWADDGVVAAWRELAKEGRFCVFELFENDELIAADFCHLVQGTSM